MLIQVRVDAEQHATLTAAARRSGAPLATWVRIIALEAARAALPKQRAVKAPKGRMKQCWKCGQDYADGAPWSTSLYCSQACLQASTPADDEAAKAAGRAR